MTRPARLVVGLLLGLMAVALLVVGINLPWFDEALAPGLVAARESKSASLEDNAYPFALGFFAAEGMDPRAAGIEMVQLLQARRDRNEPATISNAEKDAIRGKPLTLDGLGPKSREQRGPTASVQSLGKACLPRYRLDCAHQLIVRAESLDPAQPPLAVLLPRYEILLRHAHYVETPAPDPQTPWPPLSPIQELGRLRLAISFRTDPTEVFLEKASQELAFWRMTLREAQLLGTKMSALGAMRWTNDFLSTLMRERQLDASELATLRGFVHPLTREESDIGAAFLSESRTALLGGKPYVADGESWVIRLLLQKNATFNQEFRDTIEPMRRRATLDARQYYDQKAYEPLPHEFQAAPGMFYNLGGKLALRRSTWDVHQYPSRVHDEQGRITLLLLQAEIEEHPDEDVATLVEASTLRNPYTGQPMDYDPRAGTISFDCLETAIHPPEPPHRCAVDLGRAAP